MRSGRFGLSPHDFGFATGNDQKNYSYERDFTGTPDFSEIATLMLLAMHDGFGARADARLTVTAPFAKKVRAICKPAN
jgi:hypothetical protein